MRFVTWFVYVDVDAICGYTSKMQYKYLYLARQLYSTCATPLGLQSFRCIKPEVSHVDEQVHMHQFSMAHTDKKTHACMDP